MVTDTDGHCDVYYDVYFDAYFINVMTRVANSHAYGVILTHLTCYSRTHAIDKFTHAFKRNHTHTITHAIYKIENNLLCLIIVTFVRLCHCVTLFIVFMLQNHSLKISLKSD